MKNSDTLCEVFLVKSL